jgi:hypothetical protein
VSARWQRKSPHPLRLQNGECGVDQKTNQRTRGLDRAAKAPPYESTYVKMSPFTPAYRSPPSRAWYSRRSFCSSAPMAPDKDASRRSAQPRGQSARHALSHLAQHTKCTNRQAR